MKISKFSDIGANIGLHSLAALANNNRYVQTNNGIRYSVTRQKIKFINFHSRNLHSFEPKL